MQDIFKCFIWHFSEFFTLSNSVIAFRGGQYLGSNDDTKKIHGCPKCRKLFID